MITLVQITKIHDEEYRDRRVCDDCGKRRLTTRCTGHFVGTGGPYEVLLCNDCLCRTPPWPEVKS